MGCNLTMAIIFSYLIWFLRLDSEYPDIIHTFSFSAMIGSDRAYKKYLTFSACLLIDS
jgi:hypothetical protein